MFCVFLNMDSKDNNNINISPIIMEPFSLGNDEGKNNDSPIVKSNGSNYLSKEERKTGERLIRSRERNRIHARKTRQRKKEQLQSLQTKAEQLKDEQTNLKLIINEKNTANILCCLFSNKNTSRNCGEDPIVETLLLRPEDEIPDPSKLPALQPLILPSGTQHFKNCNNKNSIQQKHQEQEDLPDDGIDYKLLGKDRSQCTPVELDQIRRERNRMHAKRTRDRKRLFMEEMAGICKVLEEENQLLQQHLNYLNGVTKATSQIQNPTITMVSPSLSPTATPIEPSSEHQQNSHQLNESLMIQNGASFDQMKILLDAAGIFNLSSDINKNNNTSSCAVSISSEDHGESSRPFKKRRRFHPSTSSTLWYEEDSND